MAGILVSFWDSLFSGAMSVSGSVVLVPGMYETLIGGPEMRLRQQYCDPSFLLGMIQHGWDL